MEQEMMEAHGAAWESVFNSNTKPARYKIQRMFAVMATGYIHNSKSIEYQIFTFGISLGLFFYVYHNTLLLTSADQSASRKKGEGGA